MFTRLICTINFKLNITKKNNYEKNYNFNFMPIFIFNR